ncbi:MAG: PorT family protein [Reichenbachiella sp.]
MSGWNSTQAQVPGTLNLPNFDDQKWHFGFMLGGHSGKYRSEYVDEFIDGQFDSLHSVVPHSKVGFKIGFIINYHIFELLDVRFNPTVSFNQFEMVYRFTNGESITDLQDPTYVEFPLLLKFKSVRRLNRRMYVLVGVNPMFKATGSKEREDPTEKLISKPFNLALDVGVGMDLYQPYFKFSPELRYSFGLMNALDDKENSYSAPLKQMTIHTISFFITFEGGPSTFSKKGKKYKRKN